MTNTDLATRPTALTFDHLTPGTEGYWPIVAAVPADVQVGDRLWFVGDTAGDIVAAVDHSHALRIRVTRPNGTTFTIGRMARGFRLDRWATSATLSRKGTR